MCAQLRDLVLEFFYGLCLDFMLVEVYTVGRNHGGITRVQHGTLP
jgi:hypothetical protein